MKKYDKIYSKVPPDEVGGIYTLMASKPCRLKIHPNVIVLTQDELLDLMQEAIEHSCPTLPREKAEKLLASKLNPLTP